MNKVILTGRVTELWKLRKLVGIIGIRYWSGG